MHVCSLAARFASRGKAKATSAGAVTAKKSASSAKEITGESRLLCCLAVPDKWNNLTWHLPGYFRRNFSKRCRWILWTASRCATGSRMTDISYCIPSGSIALTTVAGRPTPARPKGFRLFWIVLAVRRIWTSSGRARTLVERVAQQTLGHNASSLPASK